MANRTLRKDSWAKVFSGGSTKIPLEAGAYQAMCEYDLKTHSIWGNSCGSIMSSVIACGYSPDDIKKITMETDFKKLVAQTWREYLINIIFRVGLVRGKKLVKFLRALFGDTKFKDLDVNLNIVGHSLNRRTYVIFNKRNTPDMELVTAVRISTSIPLFFTPYKWGDEYWVDGGLSKGFPVDLVNHSRLVGFLIQDPQDFDWSKTNFKKMAFTIFSQLAHQSSENSIRSLARDKYDWQTKDSTIYNLEGDNKTAIIIRANYSKPMYEFETSKDEKRKMMKIGYDAANKVLSTVFR